MILHYAFTQLPGAIAGFVVAAFAPAVGRYIKKFFVKESTVLKGDIKGVESNIAKKL